MLKFSERLKELRIEKGLSQKQLAEDTNYSRSAIGHWENGTRIPTADVVFAFAKFFDTTADYLLGLTDFE